MKRRCWRGEQRKPGHRFWAAQTKFCLPPRGTLVSWVVIWDHGRVVAQGGEQNGLVGP